MQNFFFKKKLNIIKFIKGERYDIVLNANQKIGNYWMRVKGLASCRHRNVSEIAILNYKGQNLPFTLARDTVNYHDLIVRGKVNINLKSKESILAKSYFVGIWVSPEYHWTIFFRIPHRKLSYEPAR